MTTTQHHTTSFQITNNKTGEAVTVLIDSDAHDVLDGPQWYTLMTGAKTYIGRRKYMGNGKYQMQYLHRLVAKAADGLVVVHKNGNPFDNRRENLEIKTRASNTSLLRQRKTGYKGVIKTKRGKKYYVRFLHEGTEYKGAFKTAIDAAKYYDSLIRKYRKDCINEQLNFPV